MTGVARFVQDRVWPRQGAAGKLAWIGLYPLAMLFGLAVSLRRAAYAIGVLRPAQAVLPVISVGNLSVGGAGKTPFALWLAQELSRRGWRPAIVLRGYGGSARTATVAARGGTPALPVAVVGDEALMLGKRFGGTVIVSRRRVEGVALAASEGCDVVVLDDGFQHLALRRDCDLVLVASPRASLLPAGPMREPMRALRRADVVVRVRRPGSLGEEEMPLPAGVACPVFEARFEAAALVESVRGEWGERPAGLLAGRRVATVAGIARPEAFHEMVRQWEPQVVEIITLDDHHPYTVEDWRVIGHRTRDAEIVLTTEKDLVKLEHFPFARGKLFALRIAPRVERGDELIDFVCDKVRRARNDGGEHERQSGTT